MTTRTAAGGVAWLEANAHLFKDGQCEKAVNNMGNFSRAYPLAILAMRASPVKLNPDFSQGYDGVIHYWTNVWGTWPGFGYCDAGHTMVQYDGLLWGDSGAITTKYGPFAGSVTKADLEGRKTNLRYAGWTPYHGPETFAGVSTAGTGHPSALTDKEDEMTIEPIYSTVNGTPSWLVMNWATGKFKVYYAQADADVISNSLGTAFGQVDEQSYNNIFALFQQLSPVTAQVVIDESKLVTDLAAALKSDPKDLAAAVAAALKPQLDALPGAVVKAEGAALSGK